MKYVSLGRTGVRVSELCFGTMSFGGDADEATSRDLYAACRNAGINFFDCADAYTQGKAEEILGRLIAHERDNLVVTSKCFNRMGGDLNAQGGNRRHVVRAVEASLKRLGTDRLDVLFMHRWDDHCPIEEVLRGLEDVVRAGKVVYTGASNYAAWQVAKALGVSEKESWTRFDVLQPMYNLVKRQAEVEILPLAQAENLGVITYSPVGGGLLSGKYTSQGGGANAGRIIENKMYASRYGDAWMHDAAAAFTDFANDKGHHPVSLAVRWAGHHTGVTAPIIGARTVEQLGPSLQSVDIDMTDDLYAEMTALTPTPAPATDRSETI